MGCGTIKTNESSQILEGNICQSELLPEVQVNKKSNIEEEKSNPNSNLNSNNKNSIQQNENTKKHDSDKNSKYSIKSIQINKKIESSKKNDEKIKEMLSSVNVASNSEEESENNNNNIEERNSEYEIEDNNNNENDNDNENDNENEPIELNIEEKENLLKKKAYTTDKIPHRKKESISSIQENLPKITENNKFSNGFLDKKFLEIEFKANRYETIFPIWIPKEEEIEFIISGKWNINKEIECDSNGIQNNNEKDDIDNNNSNKFNDGALIARILKGQPFLIYNGLKYISEISGPLILKMNLNTIWSKESPFGSLKLKIYGAQKIENADDLEEKIGWWKQLKIIGFNNKDEINDYKLSNTEKSIIILFNKLRHDSLLFTNQYLDNYQRLTPTTKRIYEQFISNKEQYIPFKINLSIIKLLQNFYNKFINDKSKIKEEDWIYILRSEEYLKKYLEESFNNKKKLFVSIIRYYEDNPFYLGLRILFRDNIRNNMLSYNFEEISIIFLSDDLRNDGKIVYYCIVVLSNQNGNDKVNYNFNNNIENFIENEKKMEVNISLVKKIEESLSIIFNKN